MGLVISIILMFVFAYITYQLSNKLQYDSVKTAIFTFIGGLIGFCILPLIKWVILGIIIYYVFKVVRNKIFKASQRG